MWYAGMDYVARESDDKLIDRAGDACLPMSFA